MTASLRSQHLVLAAVIALTAACKASESGAIPCNTDDNCPTTYPQCVGGGSSAGHCTEPVVGTPVLTPTTIAVTPAAITGGLHPTLSLALPALSGTKALARQVTLGLSLGGANEPVNKSGGAPVTLADLGTTITVDAPASSAADDKTLTYTLTVSNTPSSAATATATGSVRVIPQPVLAAGAFAATPASITGGTSPSIAIALPALTSPASSGAVVSFTVSGCGTGAVTKSGGAAVAVADLGTTIHIDAPASTASDEKICTYALTVSNAATTPAIVVATSVLMVGPLPVLSGSSFTLGAASITGGNTTAISLTLPTLMSAPNSASVVTFAVFGPAHCGSGAVLKAGGGVVGISDLNGTPISINSPAGTAATDDLTCTYALTVANAVGTHVQATGTFLVLPVPVLTPVPLTFPAVSGGATTAGIALPALSQLATAKATVGFAIISGTGCPPGNVNKTSNGGAVVATDLNTTISFVPPTSATTDDKACLYALTVSNGAVSNPAIATATGTLIVAPVPALASTNFTLTPATITGGTLTATTLSMTLPARASAALVHSTNTAKFAISGDAACGAADVPKAGGSVAVGTGDLGQPISINPPSTMPSSHLNCTYTLTLFNAANAQVTATGALTVVPKPAFSSTSLTILPNDHVAGGSSPLLNTILPSLTSDATYVPSGNVTFTISGGTVCGSGNVSKIVSAVSTPVVKGDLGTNISFNPPNSAPDSSDLCTYTISAANLTGTPEGTATATGTLTIVPTPSFGLKTLTVTPNVFLDGDTRPGLLKFMLPSLQLGSADTVTMTVSPAGSTMPALTSANLGSGIAVPVTPATTNPGDPSKVFTYSLIAHNTISGDSAPITATVTSMPAGTSTSGSRIGATSTLLPNGKVLIVGGGASMAKGVCAFSGTTNNAGDSDTGEIYDPSTGTISPVPGHMFLPRCLHTATFVATDTHHGNVFIMGGANDTATNNLKVDVFQYNDATSPFGVWKTSSLPTMAVARVGHSATLVTSGTNAGQIIAAGGYTPGYTNTTGSGLKTAELFDPVGASSSAYSGSNATFLVGRGEAAAVLAGKWLLIIGGYDPSANAGAGNFSPSVDAIDTTVATNVKTPFQSTNATVMQGFTNPSVGRCAHSAVLIGSDSTTATILVAGGITDRSGGVLAHMQNYTLTLGTGLITGTSAPVNLGTGRARFQLIAGAPVDKYLAFGGSAALASGGDTATMSVELIDTSSGISPSLFTNLTAARQALSAVTVTSTRNFTFVLSGGVPSGTGEAEVVVGP